MKRKILALAILASVNASAQVKTADNLNYLVTINANLNAQDINQCIQQICLISTEQQGKGSCSFFASIGIVHANLSTLGSRAVRRLPCVLSVEAEKTNFQEH